VDKTATYFLQQQHFDLFIQDFLEGQEQPDQADIDRLIEEIKVLERYSIDSKRFFVLFDHSKFYPAYMSANVATEGGYSVEYMLKQGLIFMFQRIHWKQLSLAYKVNVWGKRFDKLISKHSSPPINTETWCCGVKFKDRWNRWRTVILKQRPLTTNSKNAIQLSFIEAEEITNIYKADFAWYRATCDIDGKPLTCAFFSNGSKKEYSDILSPREMQILQLAAQQKSNQEIGAQLEISKNTVERHRKNMIARVGVTDMTALIRIGEMLKII